MKGPIYVEVVEGPDVLLRLKKSSASDGVDALSLNVKCY